MIQIDYHDATLVQSKLLWKEGAGELEFRLCTRESTIAVIRFEGLIEFNCPRRFPWGKSVSVNEIREDEKKGCLEIEMQSGDVIRIHAAAWTEVTPSTRG